MRRGARAGRVGWVEIGSMMGAGVGSDGMGMNARSGETVTSDAVQ